jgi:hypothetical protein
MKWTTHPQIFLRRPLRPAGRLDASLGDTSGDLFLPSPTDILALVAIAFFDGAGDFLRDLPLTAGFTGESEKSKLSSFFFDAAFFFFEPEAADSLLDALLLLILIKAFATTGVFLEEADLLLLESAADLGVDLRRFFPDEAVD